MKTAKASQKDLLKPHSQKPFFRKNGGNDYFFQKKEKRSSFLPPIPNVIQLEKGKKRPSRKTLKVIAKQASKKPRNFIHIDQFELDRRFQKKYAEALKRDADWKKTFGEPFFDNENSRMKHVLSGIIFGIQSDFIRLIKRHKKDILSMEKKLKELNANLVKLKGSLVLTDDERRGGEPPHLPYGKIHETEQKINRLNSDLSAGRWVRDSTLKQVSRTSKTIEKWSKKHAYPFSSKSFKNSIEFFAKVKIP